MYRIIFSLFFIFSFGCAGTMDHLRKVTDQRIIEKQQEANIRRAEYIVNHPTLQNRDRILEGKIDIGMTTEEVEASWGYPSDINRTSEGYEQWIYGFCDEHFCDHTYLYFKNDKLTDWQN